MRERKRLDLNLLLALRALLEEQSVTRAAQSQHITQPAMSGVLARLREHFNDPLIQQVGNSMRRTALADSLLEPLSGLLTHIDAVLSLTVDFEPAHCSRHISVAASDYSTAVLLHVALREAASKAPNMSFNILPVGPEQRSQLDRGAVDFLIVPLQFLRPSHPSCELYRDGYHGIVDETQSTTGSTVSLDEFQRLQHVLLDRAPGRSWFDTWFSQMHGEARRVAITTPTFHDLAPLVVGTNRIAVLPTRLAKSVCDIERVRMVDLNFETPVQVQMLQWHSHKDSDPATRWFRELLADVSLRLLHTSKL